MTANKTLVCLFVWLNALTRLVNELRVARETPRKTVYYMQPCITHYTKPFRSLRFLLLFREVFGANERKYCAFTNENETDAATNHAETVSIIRVHKTHEPHLLQTESTDRVKKRERRAATTADRHKIHEGLSDRNPSSTIWTVDKWNSCITFVIIEMNGNEE